MAYFSEVETEEYYEVESPEGEIRLDKTTGLITVNYHEGDYTLFLKMFKKAKRAFNKHSKENSVEIEFAEESDYE